MSEERFDRIEEKLTRHDARFDSLQTEMHDGFEAVNQRIGVLHEDLLNKIAASTERDAVSRQEFKAPSQLSDLRSRPPASQTRLPSRTRPSVPETPKQCSRAAVVRRCRLDA